MFCFDQIPYTDVKPKTEEGLFVTYCDEIGQFFGQLDKRSTVELKAMEKELFAFYGSSADKPLLLFSDCGDHIGDHGIIKWEEDGQLYRVEVMEEIGKEVCSINLI